LNEWQKRREPRVLALDPFGDFKGLTTVDSIAEAGELLNEDNSNPDRPCRIALRPSVNDDTLEFAEELFSELLQYARNFLLLADETTLWFNPQGSPRLKKVVLQGRRLGIRIGAACQQIQLVPWVLMSQLTQLAVFNTVRPQDVQVLREWVGKDVAEGASHLKQGEAYLVDL